MSAQLERKFLRYGELAARKVRNEASHDQLREMEELRKEFNQSHEVIMEEVEQIVNRKY